MARRRPRMTRKKYGLVTLALVAVGGMIAPFFFPKLGSKISQIVSKN